MNALKARFKRFVHNEGGMEFMQVAVIVLGAILLIAAIWAIYNTINNQISTIPDQINLGNPNNG